MKIQKIENRIEFCSNSRDGDSLFNGSPYVSEKIRGIIGEEGVKHIDNTLKEHLSQRKEMFGLTNRDKLKISSHQRFFDLQEQIIINVKSIVDSVKNEQGVDDYSIDVIDPDNKHDVYIENKVKERKKEGLEKQREYLKTGLVG